MSFIFSHLQSLRLFEPPPFTQGRLFYFQHYSTKFVSRLAKKLLSFALFSFIIYNKYNLNKKSKYSFKYNKLIWQKRFEVVFPFLCLKKPCKDARGNKAQYIADNYYQIVFCFYAYKTQSTEASYHNKIKPQCSRSRILVHCKKHKGQAIS